MRPLVDRGALDHEEEAIVRQVQQRQRLGGHRLERRTHAESRIVHTLEGSRLDRVPVGRQLQYLSALPVLADPPHRQGGVSEQPQDPARGPGPDLFQLRRVAYDPVTGRLGPREHRHPRVVRLCEVLEAAPEEHVDTRAGELLGNRTAPTVHLEVLGTPGRAGPIPHVPGALAETQPDVGGEAGRCRIGDAGRGHEAGPLPGRRRHLQHGFNRLARARTRGDATTTGHHPGRQRRPAAGRISSILGGRGILLEHCQHRGGTPVRERFERKRAVRGEQVISRDRQLLVVDAVPDDEDHRPRDGWRRDLHGHPSGRCLTGGQHRRHQDCSDGGREATSIHARSPRGNRYR